MHEFHVTYRKLNDVKVHGAGQMIEISSSRYTIHCFSFYYALFSYSDFHCNSVLIDYWCINSDRQRQQMSDSGNIR